MHLISPAGCERKEAHKGARALGDSPELGREGWALGRGLGGCLGCARDRYLGSVLARHPWHTPFSLEEERRKTVRKAPDPGHVACKEVGENYLAEVWCVGSEDPAVGHCPRPCDVNLQKDPVTDPAGRAPTEARPVESEWEVTCSGLLSQCDPAGPAAWCSPVAAYQ